MKLFYSRFLGVFKPHPRQNKLQSSCARFAEVLRIIFSVPPSRPRNYKLATPNFDSAGTISVYKLQQDLSLGKRSLAACYGGPWFGGVAPAADRDNERGEKP